MMTLKEYFSDFQGSEKEAIKVQWCEKLNIVRGTLEAWIYRQRKPSVPKCIQIEEITGHKVSKEELRPDIFKAS